VGDAYFGVFVIIAQMFIRPVFDSPTGEENHVILRTNAVGRWQSEIEGVSKCLIDTSLLGYLASRANLLSVLPGEHCERSMVLLPLDATFTGTTCDAENRTPLVIFYVCVRAGTNNGHIHCQNTTTAIGTFRMHCPPFAHL
jgi:hypothetical protein